MKEDKYVLESYKYVADSLQKELFCVEIKMIVIKISGVSAPPPSPSSPQQIWQDASYE